MNYATINIHTPFAIESTCIYTFSLRLQDHLPVVISMSSKTMECKYCLWMCPTPVVKILSILIGISPFQQMLLLLPPGCTTFWQTQVCVYVHVSSYNTKKLHVVDNMCTCVHMHAWSASEYGYMDIYSLQAGQCFTSEFFL